MSTIRCRTSMLPLITQYIEPPSITSWWRRGKLRVRWRNGGLRTARSACNSRRWSMSRTPTASLVRCSMVRRLGPRSDAARTMPVGRDELNRHNKGPVAESYCSDQCLFTGPSIAVQRTRPVLQHNADGLRAGRGDIVDGGGRPVLVVGERVVSEDELLGPLGNALPAPIVMTLA